MQQGDNIGRDMVGLISHYSHSIHKKNTMQGSVGTADLVRVVSLMESSRQTAVLVTSPAHQRHASEA